MAASPTDASDGPALSGSRSTPPAGLRVAGVDPERRFAGGEAQVLGLTLELARAGHQAELLCAPTGELWRRASAAGIQCRPLPIRNSIDAGAGFRLRRLVRERRYDKPRAAIAQETMGTFRDMAKSGRVAATIYFSWDSDPWAKQVSASSVYRCGAETETAKIALQP